MCLGHMLKISARKKLLSKGKRAAKSSLVFVVVCRCNKAKLPGLSAVQGSCEARTEAYTKSTSKEHWSS